MEREIIDKVVHELGHYSGEMTARARKEEEYESDQSAQIESYVEQQNDVEPEEKRTVARWAIEDAPVPLSLCAGIFFDAGSTCMAVWEALREHLHGGLVSNLAVKTNSLRVIQDFAKALKSPRMNGTKLEIVGDTLDPMHEAFFGKSAKEKLADSFLPAAIYIGTNGIEFAEFGSSTEILFGYHGEEDKEGEFKKLLFECRAKSRIIVTTPTKIGNTSGNVMDLLSIDKLDNNAPIYLVTVEPDQDSQSLEPFLKSKRIFQGELLKNRLESLQLEFYWIILERNKEGVPKVKEKLVGFEKKNTHSA